MAAVKGIGAVEAAPAALVAVRGPHDGREARGLARDAARLGRREAVAQVGVAVAVEIGPEQHGAGRVALEPAVLLVRDVDDEGVLRGARVVEDRRGCRV